MVDALSTPLPRPPDSGPGSGLDKWAAFAAQETGEPVETFEGMSRDEIKVLLEQKTDQTEVKEAPDGVKPIAEPKHKDATGRPTWSVPVVGGYAAEHEMNSAEHNRLSGRKAKG